MTTVSSKDKLKIGDYINVISGIFNVVLGKPNSHAIIIDIQDPEDQCQFELTERREHETE